MINIEGGREDSDKMSVWMTYVNRRKTSSAKIQLKYPTVGHHRIKSPRDQNLIPVSLGLSVNGLGNLLQNPIGEVIRNDSKIQL